MAARSTRAVTSSPSDRCSTRWSQAGDRSAVARAQRRSPLSCGSQPSRRASSCRSLPRELERIILRCLRKEPERRFQHMVDVKVELQEVKEESDSQTATPGAVARHRSRRRRLAWMAAGVAVLLAATLGGVLLQTRIGSPKDIASSASVRTFAIELGGTLAFGIDYPASVVLSPKGDQIAFVAESGGKRQVYVRPMDEMDARPLAGTDAAQQPFFSPDGRWLGFFAEGKLKKTSLRGGAPVVLSAAQYGMGGAWSSEGWIVYAPSDFEGLRRVPENGGEGEVFSRVDLEAGEQGHWSPTLLADQRTVLFTVYTGGRNTESRLAVQGPGDRTHRVILQGGGPGRLLSPHWLIYGRGRELLAARFDSVAGAVTGTPSAFSMAFKTRRPRPRRSSTCRTMDSRLCSGRDRGLRSRLVWLDQTGQVQGEIERSRVLGGPRLAPDGSRVAYFADPDFNVWVKDFARGPGSASRRTRDGTPSRFGVRTEVASCSPQLAKAPARSFSSRLTEVEARSDFWNRGIRDGRHPGRRTARWLAFHEEDPQTGMDVWLLDMADRRPRPLLRTPYDEAWARFSPDGAWLAYRSNQSGSFEVYACRLGEPNRRFQISAGGGTAPIWSAAGDRIYYTRGTQLMVAEVRLTGSPRIGRSACAVRDRPSRRE